MNSQAKCAIIYQLILKDFIYGKKTWFFAAHSRAVTQLRRLRKKRNVEQLSCKDIVDAFRRAYGASYEPNVAIPDELINTEFGLNISEMEDYYGEMPQIGLRCDRIVAVKANEGDVDKVIERFEQAKKGFLKNNMEYSNSMKVSEALILQEGDFVCFYMLGDDYGGENIGEGSSEESNFYKAQQQIGEECWHDIFYEK